MNDTRIEIEPLHPGTKQARILRELIYGSLNRFEAERLGDHALNSTISTLANRYDIEVARRREKCPTRFGRPVSVVRYWIPEEAKEKAHRLLQHLRRRRS